LVVTPRAEGVGRLGSSPRPDAYPPVGGPPRPVHRTNIRQIWRELWLQALDVAES